MGNKSDGKKNRRDMHRIETIFYGSYIYEKYMPEQRSIVKARSSNNPCSLRGFDADLIICSKDVDENIVEKYLHHRIAARNGVILFIDYPKE